MPPRCWRGCTAHRTLTPALLPLPSPPHTRSGPACELSAGPAEPMPVAGPLFGTQRRLLAEAEAEVEALGVSAGSVVADRAMARLGSSVPTALLAALTLCAMMGVAGAAIVLLLRPASHGHLPL